MRPNEAKHFLLKEKKFEQAQVVPRKFKLVLSYSQTIFESLRCRKEPWLRSKAAIEAAVVLLFSLKTLGTMDCIIAPSSNIALSPLASLLLSLLHFMVLQLSFALDHA